MGFYEYKAAQELESWKKRVQAPPNIFNRLTTGTQKRINNLIPEKVHQVVTEAIKQMTRAVIAGAKFTTSPSDPELSLEQREERVLDRIKFYSSTAAAEGAVTGFGGILLGLADFPLWLTLKMKLLFEIASLYGFDSSDYKERIYILHIFELTFSSQRHRNELFPTLETWDKASNELPHSVNDFDWRTFQLEYRDYIDLAKLLQLIPGVGSPVGAYVNHTLTKKLGRFAMNSYRLRLNL